MVEKESTTESSGELRELQSGIVVLYDAHLDFLKSFEAARKMGSNPQLTIFADNYAILTPPQRDIFQKSLGVFPKNYRLVLQSSAALSLAKAGDFSLADQLTQSSIVGTISDDYGKVIAESFMKIAIEKEKHGKDFSKPLEHATRAVQAYIGLKHSPADKEYIRSLLGRMAATVRDLYGDPKPYVKRVMEFEINYEAECAARVLVQNGFVDEAISLLNTIGPHALRQGTIAILADAMIQQGRIDEGLEKIEGNPQATHLTAKAALKTAELGQDPTPVIEKTKDLLMKNPGDEMLFMEIYSLLAEASWKAGGNPTPYFDAVMKKTTEMDDPIYQIQLFLKLLTTQARTTGVHHKAMESLLSVIERFNWSVGADADKLDRMEIFMGAEDTIDGLSDLGFFDIARKILHKVEVSHADEVKDDSFLPNAFAKIAVSELKGTNITVDTLLNLTPKQVTALVHTSNPHVHRALGFFNLVDASHFDLLPSHIKVAVSVGIRQREGTQSKADPYTIYQAAPDSHTTRALVKSLENIDDPLSQAMLRQVLEQKLTGNIDYDTVGRILKGLIEIKDTKGIEVATALFLDETAPTHFRLYLARKLCDSGHWDYQIINYFRDYQKQGKNLLSQIKVDSLAAIVGQMHATPSLELYKILERTRISHDREGLQQIADFGKAIFLLPILNLKDKLDIFSFWANKYESENLTTSELEQMITCFQNLSQAEATYSQKHAADKKYELLGKAVRSLYKNPRLKEEVGIIMELLTQGIYPTETIISFAQQQRGNTRKALRSLQMQTQKGNFDPTNPVQRDLEFTKYLKLASGDDLVKIYSQFIGLEVHMSKEYMRELTSKEMLEAGAAAFEAARLYWFIKERVDMGRKMIVVGNQRYGDYFVTEPLRRDLEELGIPVLSYKISSSNTTPTTVTNIFSEGFIEGLRDDYPDVVIVDGSSNRNHARLPRSMHAYINWFHAYNEATGSKSTQSTHLKDNKQYEQLVQKIAEFTPTTPYKMAFYVPTAEDTIQVGNEEIVKYIKPDRDGPYVIFANPVTTPKHDPNFPPLLHSHEPGFLDDPEKFLHEAKFIAFTETGIAQVHRQSGGENQFINSIQYHMLQAMPRMLQITNPV